MGRVPENPRTRPPLRVFYSPEPEKNITNPTRPEPEKLQTRPENPKKPEYAKNMYFLSNIHKVFTDKSQARIFSLKNIYFPHLFFKKFFQFLYFEKN